MTDGRRGVGLRQRAALQRCVPASSIAARRANCAARSARGPHVDRDAAARLSRALRLGRDPRVPRRARRSRASSWSKRTATAARSRSTARSAASQVDAGQEPSRGDDPLSEGRRRCFPSWRGCGGCSISTPMSRPSARISPATARLAPLIARRPGLRTPGAWDGFELAVRAILGQQITVVGARQLAVKIVEAAPAPRSAPDLTGDARLARVFPSAARMAKTDLSTLRHAEGADRRADGAGPSGRRAIRSCSNPPARYDETIAKLAGAARLRAVDGAVLGAARAARQRRVSRRRCRAAAQPAVARGRQAADAEGAAGARRKLAAVARLCRAASVDGGCGACLTTLLLSTA